MVNAEAEIKYVNSNWKVCLFVFFPASPSLTNYILWKKLQHWQQNPYFNFSSLGTGQKLWGGGGGVGRGIWK